MISSQLDNIRTKTSDSTHHSPIRAESSGSIATLAIIRKTHFITNMSISFTTEKIFNFFGKIFSITTHLAKFISETARKCSNTSFSKTHNIRFTWRVRKTKALQGLLNGWEYGRVASEIPGNKFSTDGKIIEEIFLIKTNYLLTTSNIAKIH